MMLSSWWVSVHPMEIDDAADLVRVIRSRRVRGRHRESMLWGWSGRVDRRDWGSRDPAGGAGQPRPGMPGGMSEAAAALTPFIPRFEWSPEYRDFPMPFPGADSTPVAARLEGPRQGATLDEVFSTTPGWMKLAPVALVLLAVTAFAAWQLLGGEDAEPEPTTAAGRRRFRRRAVSARPPSGRARAARPPARRAGPPRPARPARPPPARLARPPAPARPARRARPVRRARRGSPRPPRRS